MTHNKKYWILSIVALILVIGLAVIINQPAKEQPRTTVKIGTLFRSIVTVPLFIAKEKGFFEEHGIDVELIDMERTIRNTALIKGEIDYQVHLIEGSQAWLQGAPLKTVMAYFPQGYLFVLSTQPNLKLEEVKTIAVAYQNATVHCAALRIVRENNLSAKIIFTGPQSIPGLLAKGEIDAGVINILSGLELEREGYPIRTELVDWTGAGGLVTTQRKINENPEEVKEMIAAIQETAIFIKDNPQETKELLFSFLDLEKNERGWKEVEKVYTVLEDILSADGAISQEIQEMIIKYAKAGAFESLEDIEGQTVTEEELSEFFNFDFLK